MKEIEIRYCGKNWISRNKIDTIHWTKKEKIKKSLYLELNLSPFRSHITNFKVSVRYNSRFDVDNVSGGFKMLLDLIVQKKGIIDDSPKYFKELNIKFDNELPKNTYITKITEI
jgi:Holliday junction resolvase RusA-like endonuclease